MKKKLQGFVVGILVGAAIFGSVAMAANTTTLYNVLAQGVKIVVDGKELHPTDAGGNKVEPIIYNGTTYLPVRAVGNAVGKAVYWDGPNYTVYLGDMNGKLQYPTVRIENMTSIDDEANKSSKLTDNYGNRYSSAIDNDYLNTNLEYLLNMKYSHFKGTLYVPEGQTSDRSVYLQIIADGNIIYTSPEMTRASYPVDIDVNLRGYNDVKIQFSESARTSSYLRICLGDAGFYQ